MRTAIVLAGGRSTRFGGDKLAAEIDGRPVLAATVAALETFADGVVIAGSSLPPGFEAGGVPVALVQDGEAFAGPLAAIAGVLERGRPQADGLAVVVGGDMPRVVPAVLVAMLDRLDADRSISGLLLGAPDATDPARSGARRRRVLPLAFRVRAARTAARAALDAGERSLQALAERLSVAELPAATWLALDPGAQTLLDVDTPADLDRIRGVSGR